ncbi:gamma-glutamyltransferase [Oleiharenicola lentus]|uniref:gamma-glutamyltransferase n=1 Tax=Oleiharenicola lentus TaxID=2508720 RepID=UPI003F66637D
MKIAPRLLTGLFITSLVLGNPTALRAQRAAVEAKHGMVASVHELGSQAGLEILQKGGNAIDAAVATGLALTVVFPFAGNIGGGGFMVIHLADGRDVVIDYRETAPASATRDMYLAANGKVVEGAGSSTVGWKASGVPGSVAGFALAMQKYGSGKVTWADVCEPARRLAAEGHIVSQNTAAQLRANHEHLAQFPESKRIYLKDGALLAAGENWIQADLGETFSRLQKNGPREFYEGETARRIVAAMEKNGGSITLADLKNYVPAERAPLRGKYRGYDIVTMPPPSSGGIALLQMFGMLEPFDVAAMGYNSAAKYHLFAEVMKRAFRDRAEYLGDPGFVNVPVEKLLDPAYIKNRMADFSPDKATPAANVQPGLGKFVTAPAREKMETTHFSVVDSVGNAVSSTYTLNGAYGSGVTIPGTGILMNNEMDDFTSKVGVANMFGLLQGEANAIVPGKRPLSSMTPTMVFKDGKLVLLTGSPGGPTIINTVLLIITNVIDHKMPVMQAVEAPRIHNQWMPDVVTFERFGLSPDTMAILKAKGHTLPERKSYEGAYQGDGETIGVDSERGVFLGAADPRKGDAKAVGY